MVLIRLLTGSVLFVYIFKLSWPACYQPRLPLALLLGSLAYCYCR